MCIFVELFNLVVDRGLYLLVLHVYLLPQILVLLLQPLDFLPLFLYLLGQLLLITL